MKYVFLFDESFIVAFTAGNDGAVKIIESILNNCHRVVFSAELENKYWKLRGKIKVRNDPARYLNLLSRRPDKRVDRNDATAIPEERAIRDQNDTFLLRYASKGGAIIILEDPQTKKDINRVGQQYGVRAVNIHEAISLASER